jgi:exosortase
LLSSEALDFESGQTIQSKMSESTVRKFTTTPSWMWFWLGLLAANVPMMLPYLSGLWTQPHYQFFPFLILAVGVLIYQRWDRIWMPPRGWIIYPGIALALGISILGSYLYSPFLPAVGFVALGFFFFLSHNDQQNRTLIPLAVLSLLIIRIPMGYDQQLISQLQVTTTGLSSVLLDVLRVPHATGNNTIQLASRELFVAEACSGIQSVFTLIFLAMLLIVAYRRPIWLSPLYVVVGIILAVFANVVRVTGVALGDAWIGVDLAVGWQHEVVGYVALGLGVLFLVSFDHLIVSLLHPVELSGDMNPFIEVWNHFLDGENGSYLLNAISSGPAAMISFIQSKGIRITFLALACCVGVHGALTAAQYNLPWYNTGNGKAIILEANKSLLNVPLANLQLTDYERSRGGQNPRLGENADLWSGVVSSNPNVQVQVVLSQPYPMWHEFCVCYEGDKWTILNREVVGGMESGDSYPSFALVRMRKGEGSAYLLFGALDSVGNLVKTPTRFGRTTSRLDDFFSVEQPEVRQVGQVLMLQMFVVFPGNFEPELLPNLSSDFNEIRSAVRLALIENASAKLSVEPNDSGKELGETQP